MKKIILSILIMLSFSYGYSQMKPSEIVLKTGEKLKGRGRIVRDYFKYTTQMNTRAKKIHFSEIDFVKIIFSKDDIKTYRYFKIKDSKKSKVLEEVILGEKVSLYAITSHGYSSVTGGISIPYTSASYYVKKKTEDKATYFGNHDPLRNNLKEKVLSFFKDCDTLIKKIKNKEFRVRSDIGEMVKFYNTECQ